MSVVASLELHNAVSTSEAAREPNGGHAGFGSTGDHAHHLDAGIEPSNGTGHVDLGLGRGAKTHATLSGLTDGLDNLVVGMAQDCRTPSPTVVHITITVSIGDVSAFSGRNERWITTHGTKGPNRAIYAARH